MLNLESLRAKRIPAALLATERLTVLRPVIGDGVSRAFLSLLESLVRPNAASGPLYIELASLLWRRAASGSQSGADMWQQHLLERLLDTETPFSRAAEAFSLPAPLAEAAAADLHRLQVLFRLDGATLRQLVAAAAGDDPAQWPQWPQSAPVSTPAAPAAAAIALQRLLAAADDWSACLPDLVAHFARHGAGVLGRCHAFQVRTTAAGLALVAVTEPDPIRLSDLVGYEEPRQEVVLNTEQFLAGLPAQNLLLYGQRGTGKSSTVKALVHAYGELGLRLVQVPKGELARVSHILRALRRRLQKFILFIDDLSFEEHEVEYKDLKSALEGGLESQPRNVLVYVTSNRRHLVREAFSHRLAPGDEVRPQDVLQERLSLSDRFGKTIIFAEPDQALFVRIAVTLAQRRGLPLPAAEVEQLALRWVLWHNGRSGRAARQFVDHLEAENRFAALREHSEGSQ